MTTYAPWPAPFERPQGVSAPRAAAPGPILVASLLVAVPAALLLPGGRPGAGVLVVAAIAVAVVAAVGRLFDAWRQRTWPLVHAGAAVVLCSGAVLRDASWLVALDLLAAGAVASLALAPAGTWPGLLRSATAPVLALPRAADWLGRGIGRSTPLHRLLRLRGAALGTALALVLLAVFVPLLVSADAAFRDLLAQVFLRSPDLSRLPGRLAAFALGGGAAAAASWVLLHPSPEPVVGPPARTLSRRADWLLPLGALVLLLGAFALVQVEVWTGGREHVRSQSGLSYAQYARSGFWQLLAVTALVLLVVAAAVRWAPATRLVRSLLGALCALALLVDASALSRLRLYTEEYGLTRLRICVAATCLWLAVLVLLVIAAGLRRGGGRWLPHAVVLSAVVAVVALTAVNPEAAIARSALDRGAGADLGYVRTLSADAAPALDGLPPEVRACVLDRALGGGSEGWASANLARHRAAQLRQRLPACR